MKTLLRMTGVVVVAAAALVPGRAGAASGRPAESITNDPGSLSAVSAVSRTDAWAVGLSDCNCTSQALHWNGTRWTPVTVPGQKYAELDAVSARSATDAWAVGNRTAGSSSKTLTLRWSGTRWAQVPSPSPGTAPIVDSLTGVSTVSPTDAWAVGYYHHIGGAYFGTLMLHWNGTAWTRVAVPHFGQASLFAVSALSAADAWAVGQYLPKSGPYRTLVLHWNGTTWTQVPSPSPGYNFDLSAVSALSPTDAWAVGSYAIRRGVGVFKTLALHWNGTAWTQVPSPSPAGSSKYAFSYLYGVSALSSSTAWAVGTYGHDVGQTAVSQPLILRWNGTAWTQAASPPVADKLSGLDDVATVSPTDAWAVGYRGIANQVLVLHWNGSSWTRS
jgi:hypothetical protein